MTTQAKALKMFAYALWTALWSWIYAAGHGKPIQYLPGVELDLWLFCLGGWSLLFLPQGLWMVDKGRIEPIQKSTMIDTKDSCTQKRLIELTLPRNKK
ncbi:hypothetical protein [Pseudomonas sp. R9.37]|uniref:hypothetical protein n=1 Tax=Pseudomonas sp. R9.37 TaxID=1390498 RepID=UPI000D0DF2E2|nr:hypothetical protein [Pseudomonas sp. R9.37]PSL90751.1 hypothetical protein C7U57_28440 [Pseudomonas sp. R9.37]